MNKDASIQSFLSTMSEEKGSPTEGARAFFSLVSSRAESSGIALHDIFFGLADGYENSIVHRSLCRILGILCQYLTPTGALIVISLGIFQALQTLKSVAGALMSMVRGLIELFSHPGEALATWGASLFSSTKKDSTTDALVDMIGATVTAELPAPFVVVIQSLASHAAAPRTVSTAPAPGTTNYVAPTGTTASPAQTGTLAGQITQAIVAALGGTADSKSDSIKQDTYRMLRRGVKPEVVKDTLVRRYRAAR